jgi:Protein of unknown function (DUF2950)
MRNRSITPLPGVAILSLWFALGIAGCEKKAEHTAFASPDEAVSALIAAVRSADPTTLRKIFGPGSEDILSSGDPVADQNAKENFLAMYDASHALEPEGEEKVWLEIGAEGWPMPVPLVRRDGRWYFDGAEGADEIVYRRVGKNELGAIAVCRGYVDAQLDYASKDHDGEGAGVYAHKLVSDPGTHNGLYWDTAEGEEPSPVGPFIAAAATEGYRAGDTAYHGYRYRSLYRQTDNANGGAKEYFENGVLKNGFALVAWPAEYGVSGVMTFIVNQDGVVFQKDLGANTQHLVAAMDAYDPDSTWTAVVDSGDDTAT